MRADPKKRTMGAWLAEEIAGPLGCDVFCGPHHPGWLEKPRALMKGVENEGVFNFVTETVPSAVRAVCTEKYPWLEPPVGMSRGEMRDFMKGAYAAPLDLNFTYVTCLCIVLVEHTVTAVYRIRRAVHEASTFSGRPGNDVRRLVLGPRGVR